MQGSSSTRNVFTFALRDMRIIVPYLNPNIWVNDNHFRFIYGGLQNRRSRVRALLPLPLFRYCGEKFIPPSVAREMTEGNREALLPLPFHKNKRREVRFP